MLDRCNPYDSDQIRQEYAKAGGDLSAPDSAVSAFLPYQAQYPPSSLFSIAPLALLPWKIAFSIWITLSAALFVLAGFLMADLCDLTTSSVPLILLGVFVATSTSLLHSGQPSGPAISLCAIGAWCVLRGRFPWAGAVCFALSLAIKPQIGCFVLLYFFLAGGAARRRSLQIAGLTVLFCLPGLAWAWLMPESAHWVHDLRANMIAIAAPGGLNNPGPTSYNAHLVTDLQSIIALYRDSAPFYNHLTWAIAGVLFLVWGYVAVRAHPSHRKDLIGIAAIACLTLLPVYHRQYDVRLLLLMFPALALLFAEKGVVRWTALVLAVAVITGSHPTFIERRLGLNQNSLSKMQTLLLLRPSALAVLASALFYLACFTRTLDKRRHKSATPASAELGTQSIGNVQPAAGPSEKS